MGAELLVEAGVHHLLPLSMRHTMPTLMLGRGESPPVVSARLGHKDATTTLANYVHAMPTDAHRLARASKSIFTELLDAKGGHREHTGPKIGPQIGPPKKLFY